MKSKEGKDGGLSQSFVKGVIAVVFLILGYQIAHFIHRAAVTKIAANRDHPDTVYVYQDMSEYAGSAPEKSLQPSKESSVEGKSAVEMRTERRNAGHSPRAEAVRNNLPRQAVETFRFNPNTVSVEDLCRLGFTPKQAQAIDNYRAKGGRFRRRSDFARSFVVADSVYARLEPFIDIPLLDLNLADSAALDALPGIGGWYASKIIEYRTALRGFSYKEQLLDIYRFDQEKYDALEDLVVVSETHVSEYPLWTYPADSLRRHPYIGNYETARAVVLYRNNTPRPEWSVEGLSEAGVLSKDKAEKLSRCIIAAP